jgi:hypothetical protein
MDEPANPPGTSEPPWRRVAVRLRLRPHENHPGDPDPDISVIDTTTAIKLNSDPDPISAPIFAPAIAAMATTITTSQQHSEYATSNFRHVRIQQTRIFDATIPSGGLPKCMKSDRINEQNGALEKCRSNPCVSSDFSASRTRRLAGYVIISGASPVIKYMAISR